MFTPFAFLVTNQPAFSPISPSLQYLLLGGTFTLYNAPSTNYIAKIDTNGDLILDNSFNPGTGISNVAYDIQQQPDGKYVIGGNFTTYSGSNTSRVVRINQNGTVDTTFAANGAFNSTVLCALPFSNNSVLAGGIITTYISGSTTYNANRIIKFNSSGAIDPTFNTGFGFNNQVNVFATQSDGKIIAAGFFSQYSSSNNCITRTDLSGSLTSGPGTGFNTGAGFSTQVDTFATQSDGKIIVVGGFTTYSGSTRNYITRLNTDGTIDSTFNVGTGFNVEAMRVKVQSDGKIVVAGGFTTYSGSSQAGIVRLNISGTIDTTFNVGNGLNGNPAYALAIQSDGKYIIGGNYLTYSSSLLSSVRITRINTDGTLDTTFNTGAGANSIVNSIELQSDGKAIVGGIFTTYSGSSRNYITRLNTDGTIDNTFNIGTGFSSYVQEVFIEPNTQKVIAMGAFTSYSGSTYNRIIRLNTDGTRDTSFNMGTGLNAMSGFPPNHISIQSDNKIYIAGPFTTYNGSTINNFARINSSGTLDTTFPYTNTSSAAGFNSTVRTIFVSGSNIYFGGNFTSYRGTNSIIRLNTDGTWDNTFQIGESFAVGVEVTDILVEPNDKIVLVGAFTSYSGSSTNTTRIIRLNSDGTQDTSFVTGAGPSSTPYSITRRPDGKFVMIGAFTTYSGSSTIPYIIGINQSGSRDTTFNVGSGIPSIGVGTRSAKVISTPDNKIYVTAPLVTTYSGSTSGNIFRLNASGSIDTTFNPISSNAFNRTGFGLATTSGNPGGYSMILSGSSVIVVGQFATYKSPVVLRGGMIDPTGSISSSFNMGSVGFSSTVRTWATQSDGKILAGGDFTTYSGSSTNTTRIIRLNKNGTQDATFVSGTGFSSTVYDIRVQSDGKIIAVGTFNTYSGSTVNGIVRLNVSGTIDNTFNVGAGFTLSTQGNHCKIQPDGKIIVVGAFTTYSGSAVNRIVRINDSGSIDNTFNVGAGFPTVAESVILQPDGKILVGGQFASYSGSTQNRIARINTDGTRDTSFNSGTGFGASTYALALQSDGKIIVTHQNQSYSGSTTRFITRINPSGTFDSTFNANANSSLSSTSTTQNSLAISNDGSIYWGNSFAIFSGSFTPNGIVKLNTSGTVDQTFNQSFPNYANNTGKGVNATVTALLLL